jgi:hypothetical protein
MKAAPANTDMQDGEEIEVDFQTGKIERLKTAEIIPGEPSSSVQMEIYQRGRLLG